MQTNMWISKSVIAVILGGGAGSRLYPLTRNRSKPAVPIAGKYRLVDIPISNCINSNINRIFVLTQFNSASLNKHIKNTYQFSNFSSGFVDILAAEQTPESSEWFQGTADAVRQSLRYLTVLEYDHVLILSGDQLYQMDFGNMFRTHAKENADITIATIPVTQKEATEFGILKSDDQNKITSFIEKPGLDLLPDWVSETSEEMQNAGRNYLASMGIYLFKKEVLIDLLENQKKILLILEKRSSHLRSKITMFSVINTVATGQILEIFLLSLKPTLHSHRNFLRSIFFIMSKKSIRAQECCLLQKLVEVHC